MYKVQPLRTGVPLRPHIGFVEDGAFLRLTGHDHALASDTSNRDVIQRHRVLMQKNDEVRLPAVKKTIFSVKRCLLSQGAMLNQYISNIENFIIFAKTIEIRDYRLLACPLYCP